MANGDKASGVGWTISAGTDDIRVGYDRTNYALDRTAEQYLTLRDTVLPAINQPIFAVKRSDNAVSTVNGRWTQAGAGWWAAPVLSTGFKGWSGGQLTVNKSGVYRLTAHVQYVGAYRESVGIQVVRNTTTADTASTLIKNDNGGRGTTATDLVRLVAGDVLVVLVRAEGRENPIGEAAADLTLSAEWVRA